MMKCIIKLPMIYTMYIYIIHFYLYLDTFRFLGMDQEIFHCAHYIMVFLCCNEYI